MRHPQKAIKLIIILIIPTKKKESPKTPKTDAPKTQMRHQWNSQPKNIRSRNHCVGVHFKQTVYSTYVKSPWLHVQSTWRQHQPSNGSNRIHRWLYNNDRWTSIETSRGTFEENARRWQTMEQFIIQVRTTPKPPEEWLPCYILHVQASRRASNET